MSNALIVKPAEIVAASASSTSAGKSAIHVANDYMGMVWQSAAGSSAMLTVDLGEDVACDTALLFGCDDATADMTLTVEANTAAHGASFAAPEWAGEVQPLLAGEAMPVNGRGVALWQAGDSAPAPSRYWRFTIGALDGGKATVARVALGADIGRLIARNFAFGAGFGVRDTGSIDFNRLGVMLRKRGTKLRTVGLSFPALHRDEAEAHILPLIERVGNTECVALVTDPAEHAMRQRRAHFGPLFGDYSAGLVWRKADAFQVQFNVVSLI